MQRRRRTVCLAATTVAVLAFGAAAETSHAAPAGAQARIDKRQDKRVRSLRNQTKVLTMTVADQGKALADLKTGVEAIDNRVKAIEGAAPQLIAGLTKLADAYTAVEYGVARLYSGSTAVPGATIVTSDIPDDGNTASANGTLPFVSAGSEALTLRGAIRSVEADGEASGDPAGQAGGILYAICAAPPPNTGCATAGVVTPGQIACTAGPTPSQPFNTPAGTQNLPLVEIQEKDERTDQAAPTSSDTNITDATCDLPAGGGVYNLFVTTSFVDLPTSASPGPKD